MMYTKHLLRTASVLLLSAALIVPAQVSASADTVVHTTAASPVTHILASTKAFSKAPVPKVTGVRQVGKALTAVAGTWKSKPTTLRYQWTRNGKPIAHATAKTYTLGAADGGTRVGVVVTAKRSGYKTTSRTSAVSVIALATFVKATRPIASGDAVYGHTLQVYLGAWSPAPIASYQWKSAGKPIAGATRASYTVAKTDVGHQITVTVTGKRAGYNTVVATSVGTKVVPAIQAPSTTVPADSESLVNVDIVPGTYIATSGTVDCEWERYSRNQDELGYGFGPGQRIVTISASDYEFYSDGCGTWTPIANVALTALTTIPDGGAFAVGSQVQPGEYTAPNPLGTCYWSLYSDYSGSEDSWIDYDYPESANVTVRVPANAALFEVDGCGPWTRIAD
ncbi:hypothetical protein [Glaciihabitans sp. dw_435]|uniref:hypothetical protein n=1 Tax=Glaciihabitans sp. dw_435 TaxID=2720081 RepID=UPI001BD56671|nr:hypothetical protein [Glaciihabitans sp. dw_435]